LTSAKELSSEIIWQRNEACTVDISSAAAIPFQVAHTTADQKADVDFPEVDNHSQG
jgi:hypothetical protein